uniref:Uncharacterized protein n=1 Tax=Trypanosoma vivax (strain Y486) TaxID=1055687 RepID=G0TYL0_TRYVY|nr:conserved hypothetical protein, fragment [Trypanosoma vivax Y486]
MTEGRFETIHNLRPKNWDGRRHWTNWHHLYDCEKDHLARESCPFHDLRSGGQFQYENWGGGEFRLPIEPSRLNNRLCGDRMDFARGAGTQIGGLGDIPLDTEAGRPTQHNKHPGTTVMYTKKNPLNRGLFGRFPYIPEAPHTTAQGSSATGPNHLRSGPAKAKPEDYPPWMPDGEPEKRKRRVPGVFRAGKPRGIINDIEWIPNPLIEGGVKKQARPFRTWHTRTKWSMPTHAPWSTGRITAEPFRGPKLNTTVSGLPDLSSFNKVNMTQTIGKEAALESAKPPERVVFK